MVTTTAGRLGAIFCQLALALCLVFRGAGVQAANFTVDDIRAGVEARRSSVSTLKLMYRWQQERTPWFYKSEDVAFERLVKGGLRKPEDRQPAADKTASGRFEIAIRGDKIAYKVYDPSDKNSELQERAVFDGELLRWYNPRKKSALIDRVTATQAIPFALVTKALGDGNNTLDDILATKVETKEFAARWQFNIHCRRSSLWPNRCVPPAMSQKTKP